MEKHEGLGSAIVYIVVATASKYTSFMTNHECQLQKSTYNMVHIAVRCCHVVLTL